MTSKISYGKIDIINCCKHGGFLHKSVPKKLQCLYYCDGKRKNNNVP